MKENYTSVIGGSDGILVTGSTGAHKSTALAAMIADGYPVLPEAATILWSGGFPDNKSPQVRAELAVQIAIMQIQYAQEHIEGEKRRTFLCDRGMIDSIAYSRFAQGLGRDSTYEEVEEVVALFMSFYRPETTLQDLYRRYNACIFMALPEESEWRHNNPHRAESYEDAMAFQEILFALHRFHPRVYVLHGKGDMSSKIASIHEIIADSRNRDIDAAVRNLTMESALEIFDDIFPGLGLTFKDFLV